jgi:Fibronectin type III domain
MDPVSIYGDINPVDINITWSLLTTAAADTGSEPITGYRLKWAKTSSGSWTTLTTSGPTTSHYDVLAANY